MGLRNKSSTEVVQVMSEEAVMSPDECTNLGSDNLQDTISFLSSVVAAKKNPEVFKVGSCTKLICFGNV